MRYSRHAPSHIIPQSDGLIERLNRKLLALLSTLSADSPDDWDDHLPYVMCAYQATIHQSTGSIPNRFILGREITLPVDLMLTSPDELAENCCQIEYVATKCDVTQFRASSESAVDSDDEGVETGGRIYPDVPTTSSVVHRGKRR